MELSLRIALGLTGIVFRARVPNTCDMKTSARKGVCVYVVVNGLQAEVSFIPSMRSVLS